MDWEAIGLETFTLEELDKEMKEYPERFTQDIKDMIIDYREYLVPANQL